jgi:hypothetical protein
MVVEQVASRHDLNPVIFASGRDILPSLLPRFLRKSVYLLKLSNDNDLKPGAQAAGVQAQSIDRALRPFSCSMLSFAGIVSQSA